MNASSHQQTWEDAVRWLREQPDQQALVRDAYYDDPLIESAERYWRSEEWCEVARLLPAGGTALDVGAGRGIASYALAKQGFEVSALEPDPSNLVGAGAIRALAGETGLKINIVAAFSERMPFDDAMFDVVFARAVLHHTSDLKAAMREFARVLKPGGTFLGIREHVISREEDRTAFWNVHPLHHRYGGEDAFRLPVYVEAIENSGLELRKTLKPLTSAINYAPYTKAALDRELAERFARVPGLALVMRTALGMPVVGAAVKTFAGLFDHRPGRLYSFVAVRPQ